MTAKEVLKRYWGYDAFRPLQEDIIQSVVDGRHTVALLPTGGGKSVCFQVPALMLEGVCLVISPLIALMRDQVDQLHRRQIKAIAIYSGMGKREIDIALDNCVYGEVKFLYVSPERLKTPLFLARAERMKISMIAIDEAHCISQWGYDFRPPYLEIHDFVERRGIEKVIALTATATKEVKNDIVEKLQLTDAHVFAKSFARPNLSYSVFNTESKEEKLVEILTKVPGSAVVYVRSRKMTEVVARTLRGHGLVADFYHAGLSGEEREKRQTLWITGSLRVIVATNAFGMGIDKPDVRSVVHLDLPDSLEAYYQEAGRAGRDERKAYAVLLYTAADVQRLLDQVAKSHVSLKTIRRVYQALANYYKLAVGSLPDKSMPLEVEQFARTYEIPVLEAFNSLKKLEDKGVVALSESFHHSSQVILLQRKEDLYRFQVAHPRLDRLIKALLRLYGGRLFEEFVSIKEGELGKILNVSRSQIIQWLDLLVQFEVIDYVKQIGGTQLSFILPRMDPNDLPIDEEQLKSRARIASEKAESMIEYAQQQDKCRTRMLQAYFDEQSDEDCGVCDYCVRRKKAGTGISAAELYALLEEHAPIAIDRIIALKAGWRQEALQVALRVLVEEGKVEIGRDAVRLI